MTDSERLDALGRYGLCVVAHDSLVNTEWERTWVCSYVVNLDQRLIMGPSIRDVIDAAILDIEANSDIQH